MPTSAETGLPYFTGGTWNVVAAPAGTPREIVDRLNVALNKALKDATLRERLKQLGIETVDDSSPASTRVFVEPEIVTWRDVVQVADPKED